MSSHTFVLKSTDPALTIEAKHKGVFTFKSASHPDVIADVHYSESGRRTDKEMHKGDHIAVPRCTMNVSIHRKEPGEVSGEFVLLYQK
jgi:hypothetical protein